MEQQLSRAVTHKKKTSKRIPMVAAALLTLSLGAGQAYAALNGYDNVWSLLKELFDNTEKQVVATTDKDLSNLETDFKREVGQLVNSKVDKAIEDVNKHEQNEIINARAELNSHLAVIGNELDEQIKTETDRIKQNVTQKVDDGVADIEDAMREEVERQLQTRNNGK